MSWWSLNDFHGLGENGKQSFRNVHFGEWLAILTFVLDCFFSHVGQSADVNSEHARHCCCLAHNRCTSRWHEWLSLCYWAAQMRKLEKTNVKRNQNKNNSAVFKMSENGEIYLWKAKSKMSWPFSPSLWKLFILHQLQQIAFGLFNSKNLRGHCQSMHWSEILPYTTCIGIIF